jgi:mannose-1-phosphate guanylyltransferase
LQLVRRIDHHLWDSLAEPGLFRRRNVSRTIQAVVLVGGLGTRISHLYPALPKALIPIAGKPFVAWLITWLRRGGIDAIHLAAGHLADGLLTFVNYLAEGGERVTISREDRPLGTAGALRFAKAYVCSDPFIVVNGDTMLPCLDFGALERRHRESDASVTIAVTRMEQRGEYGTVVFDENGRLTAFREKRESTAGWVNGGVYIVDASVVEAIQPAVETSLETQVFPKLAREGVMYAFPTEPPLLDMGTPRGLKETESYMRRTAEREGLNDVSGSRRRSESSTFGEDDQESR